MTRLFIAFLVFGLMPTMAFPDSRERYDSVLHVGHLIAAPGEEIQERVSLMIVDGKIVAIKKGYVDDPHAIDLKNSYVMPGLIDLHSHIGWPALPADYALDVVTHHYQMRKSALVLAAIPRVKKLLKEGITTIRTLGDGAGITYDLRDAIERGIVDGPRIIGVEQQITVSGGDYDPASLRLRPEFEQHLPISAYGTGPQELTAIVRREILRGAGVIKFRISGGIEGEVIETDDEIAAVVAAARQQRITVAVHNHKPKATGMLLRAGVDTIEHGPLDLTAMPDMAAKGIIYIPTLAAIAGTNDGIKEAHHRDLYGEILQTATAAYGAGVPIGYGSDMAQDPVWGARIELRFLNEAGLSTVDALRAATTVASKALAREMDLGALRTGMTADVIAMPRNPLVSLDALLGVNFVMKAGRVYK